jgi:Alcohol dehydrogenase transcription factor Myb/SANT-like
MANSDTVDQVISKTVESIDDFEFIDAYKTHPCLYNTSLALYKNRYAKDVAYENLSQKFSVSIGRLTMYIFSVNLVCYKSFRQNVL